MDVFSLCYPTEILVWRGYYLGEDSKCHSRDCEAGEGSKCQACFVQNLRTAHKQCALCNKGFFRHLLQKKVSFWVQQLQDSKIFFWLRELQHIWSHGTFVVHFSDLRKWQRVDLWALHLRCWLQWVLCSVQRVPCCVMLMACRNHIVLGGTPNLLLQGPPGSLGSLWVFLAWDWFSSTGHGKARGSKQPQSMCGLQPGLWHYWSSHVPTFQLQHSKWIRLVSTISKGCKLICTNFYV